MAEYKNNNYYFQTDSVYKSAVKKSGDIDILVNNAGVVNQGGFDELDMSAFESQMKTNYLSAVGFFK